MLSLLRDITFYHFHDTSPQSYLRTPSKASDHKHLRANGSNLATWLHRLRSSPVRDEQLCFAKISRIMRQIAPAIKELTPDFTDGARSHVSLDWVDTADHALNATHLSDGSLRALALFSALLQPTPPAFFSIDEPELGLHPSAIALFMEQLRLSARASQIVIATQSPALMDYFSPEEVILVDYRADQSHFRKVTRPEVEAWLDEYTLSEIYEKNVLGGLP